MKKNKIFALTILALIFCFATILAGCQEEIKEAPREFDDQLPIVKGDPNVHVTFTVEDDGFNVYAPFEGKGGYRYGPSIMYYPDGSVDAWFASKGISGDWDWFTYRHSDDGGKTWSGEKIVLQPTGNSYDHYSVCDPGVIYFNGYYYMGYTSTLIETGVGNNVFVARSAEPDGPFEKWNGTGWGGDPKPLIYYDEGETGWGAGEPSFVVLEDTLYIYYTWTCPDGDYTMVATADATSENWPATLEYHGEAYQKLGNYRQDSCDVVYIEDIGKFVAFSTYERFTENSGICVMESDDGIHFTQSDIIRTGTMQCLHNLGISKRSDGHIQLDDALCFIGYAYGDGRSWAKWATRFQNITISYYEGPVESRDQDGIGNECDDYFWELPEELDPIGISVKSESRHLQLNEYSEETLKLYTVNSFMRLTKIKDTSDVKITGYDKSIIKVNGLKIQGLAPGTTYLLVQYKDFYTTVTVTVYKDWKYQYLPSVITEFRPVETVYDVPLNAENNILHKKQIRGYVVFNNYSWGEAYNAYTSSRPDKPPVVPAEKYLMTFHVENPEIISVSANGIITPKKIGTTTVTVTMNGEKSFTVTVNVT